MSDQSLSVSGVYPHANGKLKIVTIRWGDNPKHAAEDKAMAMALYSRDPRSIIDHIEAVKKRGSESFILTYYVGYGDRSIGDSAETTVCIEGCSFIAAKWIQDNPLYNGQEASTRYINFEKQDFLLPTETPGARAYVEKLRAFYAKGLPILIRKIAKENGIDFPEEVLSGKVPVNADQRAVKAAAFDIIRSFLPAGGSTFVGLSMSIRALADYVPWLRHSPLQEVRDIADLMWTALQDQHPYSFKHAPKDEDHLQYMAMQMENRSIAEEASSSDVMPPVSVNFLWNVNYPKVGLEMFKQPRPKKCELHPSVNWGMPFVQSNVVIDYGGYRDLQRHRPMIPKGFPMLSTGLGFHQWYLDKLPSELLAEANALINEAREVEKLFSNPNDAQYALPMGFKVNFSFTATWSQADFLGDLRTGPFVHPTVRLAMIEFVEKVNNEPMLKALLSHYPGLKLRYNADPSRFYTARGKQTILKKE